MDAVFLVAYVAALTIAYLRVRRLAWLVVGVVVAVSVMGALTNLAIDVGFSWTRAGLQWVLLAALAAVLVAAFILPRKGRGAQGRPWLGVGVPTLLLLGFFGLVGWVLADGPAFMRPVSYLIGHGTAEDNAKWLDFTAQLATGGEIDQGVPLGGPLALTLTFVATVMGLVSVLTLGGYNEVAVAANTVVWGSYFLAAVAPLALSPLAEGIRGRSQTRGRWTPPWPVMWLGSAVLVAASLVVTGYGHLTFQYTVIVMALWSSVFLSGMSGRRVRLAASLAAAATMTVWLPLNLLAATILLGWLVVFLVRLARRADGAVDPLAWILWLIVVVSLWTPLWSSVQFALGGVLAASDAIGAGGGALGVAALAIAANDNSLFSSPGGTDQVGPILGILAAVSGVAAAGVLVRRLGQRAGAKALAPMGLLVGFALLITLADFWVTGSGPHYGALKFGFLAAVIALSTSIPVAFAAIEGATAGMTTLKWAALAAVASLLAVDTLLPRALAATRPDQWSPPIPFENTSGSYWYPADVSGDPEQTIAENPVACVYLPQGAPAPSAILDSQLSDAQRVYNCTRILAGLAGMDTQAQPLVDWLRREWLTNTRAWSDVYVYLAEMEQDVRDKKVILLDDGSNVIGLETVDSLLQRFPVPPPQ